MDAQITQILKFRYCQYMENARKHLFRPIDYPHINCNHYHIPQAHIWLHVLLYWTEPHMYKLRTNWHNKALQEIIIFLVSLSKSKCFTLTNASKFNGKPQENTLPQWLFPCTCTNLIQRCHYNALQKIRNFLVSSFKSRCFTFTNAGKKMANDKKIQYNNGSSLALVQISHKDATTMPTLILIFYASTQPNTNFNIQFIEFT